MEKVHILIARDSNYSINYCVDDDNNWDNLDERYILLNKVYIGISVDDEDYYSSDIHDSIVNNFYNQEIFVIPQNNRSFPIYLIKFGIYNTTLSVQNIFSLFALIAIILLSMILCMCYYIYIHCFNRFFI